MYKKKETNLYAINKLKSEIRDSKDQLNHWAWNLLGVIYSIVSFFKIH